jgi:hypothetical protein
MALDGKKLRAIRLALLTGERLQREHPEIAYEYRSACIPQIAAAHAIPTVYSLETHVAHRAMHFALHGHTGGYGVPPYAGLLDKETLEQICHEHKRVSGFASLRDGTGLYSRTPEEVRADNSAAGKALLAQRKGMFKLTKKERQALGYKNQHYLKNYFDTRTPEQRAADIRKQGMTPWADSTDKLPSELEYALSLAALPENKRGTRLNSERIAQQLNLIYHGGSEVRNRSSVSSYLSLWRKKQEK